MEACIIRDMALVCNMGDDVHTILNGLAVGEYGEMKLVRMGEKQAPAGIVSLPLPEIREKEWNTRTNALLKHCLKKLRPIWSDVEPAKIGVVIGSSNAGIEEYSESWSPDYVDEIALKQLEGGNVARFVAHEVGAQGPCYTINTACSSSAKALASAKRLLDSGICDMVIAGGGDGLCHYALCGFDALQLISDTRSTALTLNGGGVNHGEGAALFVLTRGIPEAGNILIAGYGETADAHHTTTPDPEGIQAVDAMQKAMRMGRISPQDVGYVNLHGTGTDANDTMEINAMLTVFGDRQPPCSSTKPYTGHTLGAAGAIEAALCIAMLQRAQCQLPLQPWLNGLTDLPPLNLSAQTEKPLRHIISNSFAFGGNNIALLVSRHA